MVCGFVGSMDNAKLSIGQAIAIINEYLLPLNIVGIVGEPAFHSLPCLE